jgi:hypothetical protein
MMRASLAAASCLLLARVAAAAPPSAAQCAAITSPAPCGQVGDSQAVCEVKGCCYDASFTTSPCFYGGGNAVPITTVLVVEASHFDAGFADSTTGILMRWWWQHFPRAWLIGSNLTASGGPGAPQLKFTTQSWILSLFFDCPQNVPGLVCPTPELIANVTSAINAGYLTWHAWPHNGEYELLDDFMIEQGFALTHRLDDTFAQPHKATVSQRDVPGMTRGAIPVLLQNGIRAVSVGVNGASTPPKVPRAFIWRDEASNTSIPAMWHPYGYGGIDFEDAVILPGLSTAVVFDWRGDNAGPWDNVGEAYADWASISKTFPGAAIYASTFDNFTALLQDPAVQALLPVVTSEIGDTWLHGAGSDPLKTARARVAQRVLRECAEAGTCDVNSYQVQNFTRFLLKDEEHTWGRDVKTFLHDTTHWTNSDLQLALAQNLSNFALILSSWVEQRSYGFDYALQALPDGDPLKASVLAAWEELTPPPVQPNPAASGWTSATPGTPYTVGRYTLAFDAATGALSSLIDGGNGNAVWADAASPLAFFEYVTWDDADYAAFLVNYCALSPPPSWFLLDFGKPNMTIANPLHQEIVQSLVSLWTQTDAAAGRTSFLVHARIGDGSQHLLAGAPSDLWLQFDVPTATGAAGAAINITAAAYNKTATRLPEALFLRFNASGAGSPTGLPTWAADKIGSWVDPFDVVMGGNKYHHAVGLRGVQATKPAGSMRVGSLDAPLTSWGSPRLLPTPQNITTGADPSEGAAYMLVNNAWGTNYPCWYPFEDADSNMQWRFTLSF